jgi:hypothetical protein
MERNLQDALARLTSVQPVKALTLPGDPAPTP